MHIMTEHFGIFRRDVLLGQKSRPDRIIHIVVEIGDLVGKPHHTAFECRGMTAGPVVADAVTYLKGKIQPLTVLFQDLHHTDGLFAVDKPRGAEPVQDRLAAVPEGRMPEVMPERDRLRQVLVETKSLCDRPRDLRDL